MGARRVGFALVLATVAGLMGVRPAPAATFLDTFDDNLIDAVRWREFEQGGPTIAEVNNRLEVTVPATSSGSYFAARYDSNCVLTGDFDIRVDYQLITWPNATGIRIGLAGLSGVSGAVQRVAFANNEFSGQPRQSYVSDFASGTYGIVGTSHTSGSLRWKRTGSTAEGAFLSGASWSVMGTGTVSTAAMGFTLAMWDHNYYFNGQAAKIAFDNFRVESGTMVCPVANLSWTIDDGFGARDERGIVIYPTPEQVRDPIRTLRLNGCSNTGTGTLTYKWSIDGGPLQDTGSTCTFAAQIRPGPHTARLLVRDSTGRTLEGTQSITLRDYLIVSLGDSYASGEGNPDVGVGAGGPVWKDRQCHRSALAGPSLAAQELDTSSQSTTVTFVHLACSGATIMNGILGPHRGADDDKDPELPAQLTQLRDIMDPDANGFARPVDSVLISIGGNDVGFGGIIDSCLKQTSCHNGPALYCSLPRSRRIPGGCDDVPANFERAMRELPGKYSALASCLSNLPDCPVTSAHLSIPASKIHITQYPDPTYDDSGERCRNMMGGFIDADEARWASEVVLARLNGAVSDASTLHNWSFVDGVSDPFVSPNGHGECADDHWIVRLNESLLGQGNEKGTLHPNQRGQQIYRDALLVAGIV